MKKNLLIAALILISLSLVLFSFAAKTQAQSAERMTLECQQQGVEIMKEVEIIKNIAANEAAISAQLTLELQERINELDKRNNSN